MGHMDDGIDGILVLDGEYPLGMDIREALELHDDVMEFEITSNRPDCLKHGRYSKRSCCYFGYWIILCLISNWLRV
jgi:hypothetical protein